MNTETFLPSSWMQALTAVLVAVFLSACAHLTPPQSESEAEVEPPLTEAKPAPEPMKPPPPSPLYEWYGVDGYVSHIEVSINEQKARFYNGDKQVGWTRVASGIHKYPTPVGKFAVIEKVQNKTSNLYGRIYNKNGKLVKSNAKMGVDPVPPGGHFKGAAMPYFLRLTNDGIGMHAGPIPRPGNRASHGCIRMPKKFAPILYNYVAMGTPVTIKGKGPSYATYLAKQRTSRPNPPPTEVAKTNAPTTAPIDATPASTPPDHAASKVPATAAQENQTVTQPAAVPNPSNPSPATAAPSASGVSSNVLTPPYGATQPSHPTGTNAPATLTTPAVSENPSPDTKSTETLPTTSAVAPQPTVADTPSSTPKNSISEPTQAPSPQAATPGAKQASPPDKVGITSPTTSAPALTPTAPTPEASQRRTSVPANKNSDTPASPPPPPTSPSAPVKPTP